MTAFHPPAPFFRESRLQLLDALSSKRAPMLRVGRPCCRFRRSVTFCAAHGSDGEADAVAAGKLRVRAVLARAIPRLFEFPLGARELLQGDIFATDIKFTLPVWWPGTGRIGLNMLLMSLPIQVSLGMLQPKVENVMIDSPSRMELTVRYSVRWQVADWANLHGIGQSKDEETSSVDSKESTDDTKHIEKHEMSPCILHVRSRLRFDEKGEVAEWHDTWNRSFSDFFRELSKLLEENSASNEAEQLHAGTATSKGPEAKHENMSSETIFLRESSDRHDKRVANADTTEVAGAESSRDTGRMLSSEKVEIVADVMRGPANDRLKSISRLSPDALQRKAHAVMTYVCNGISRVGSKKFPEIDFDYIQDHAVLEVNGMRAQGHIAMKYFIKHIATKCTVMYSSMDVVCLSVKQMSPRVLATRYLWRGRSRWGGSSQIGLYCTLSLDGRGDIARISICDMPISDPSYALFSRMDRRTWVW